MIFAEQKVEVHNFQILPIIHEINVLIGLHIPVVRSSGQSISLN